MWPADLARLSSARTDMHKEYAVQTLALARQCEVPEVRKRAFYELLRSDGFGQGSKEDDDVMMVDDEESLGDDGTQLLRTELFLLVRARERLQRYWLQITRAPPTPSTLPCQLEQFPNASQEAALKRCHAARSASVAQWTTEVTRAAVFEEGLYDPLCALESLANLDWSGMGYCLGCVAGRRDLWAAEREKLWKDLDRWLGIESEPHVKSMSP